MSVLTSRTAKAGAWQSWCVVGMTESYPSFWSTLFILQSTFSYLYEAIPRPSLVQSNCCKSRLLCTAFSFESVWILPCISVFADRKTLNMATWELSVLDLKMESHLQTRYSLDICEIQISCARMNVSQAAMISSLTS
jgi:hypothetical protein